MLGKQVGMVCDLLGKLLGLNLCYRFPPDVQPIVTSPRVLFTTLQGGKVVVDAFILALWQYANQRNLNEIVAEFCMAGKSPLETRAALACLAEAGLLVRDGETYMHKSFRSGEASSFRPSNDFLPISESFLGISGVLVSVIVVTYNSIEWLKSCFNSLSRQTYSPLEIVVVDNASSDGSASWVATYFPDAKLVCLTTRQSLAHAINRGAEIARGDYFLTLNPDVQLEADAIAQMIAVAQDDVLCAAVAPKLRLIWAPAFLNGLGNHVGACSWAMDNGLGHLDLGQFDAWRHVPSACFAATLISRAAWEKIGALDEKFPLYYEDNEWCYRARLMGYTIRAAPQAIVYHAFGARVPSGAARSMSAEKLQNVIYNRLRFAVKLLRPLLLARFLLSYAIEDCCRFLYALTRWDSDSARACMCAWRNFIQELPVLIRERAIVQAKRVLSDHALFDGQAEIPAPLIWNGLPELTWDLVRNHYLPLILAGKAKVPAEFANVDIEKARQEFVRQGLIARACAIWRAEGWRFVLYRLSRYIQWRLALP